LKLTTEPYSNVDSDRGGECALPAKLGLLLIRAYKLLISPYLTGSCRFLPSCSDYAAEAVARYGLCRGSWLAAKRLVRCHPFCAAGCDPVPRKTFGK